MAGSKAARRRGNCERANVKKDAAIVAQNEWDWAMKRLGWVLGICFGIVFALALIAG